MALHSFRFLKLSLRFVLECCYLEMNWSSYVLLLCFMRSTRRMFSQGLMLSTAKAHSFNTLPCDLLGFPLWFMGTGVIFVWVLETVPCNASGWFFPQSKMVPPPKKNKKIKWFPYVYVVISTPEGRQSMPLHVCHLDMWIVLSWRQLRPSRLRKLSSKLPKRI